MIGPWLLERMAERAELVARSITLVSAPLECTACAMVWSATYPANAPLLMTCPFCKAEAAVRT